MWCKQASSFILLDVDVQFSSTICWRLFFAHFGFWHHCQRSFGYICEVLFLGCLLCFIWLYVCFYVLPHCFDYCNFVICFEIRTYGVSFVLRVFFPGSGKKKLASILIILHYITWTTDKFGEDWHLNITGF